MFSCEVKPQSPMSVLVGVDQLFQVLDLELRAGRRAHRVRAVRIGRGGLVGDELAQRLPARAVLRGEAERGRERLDAGLLAGGVSVFLEPEEVLHQHQLGERRAVLLLRDRLELVAEGRKARIAVGLGRRDRERRIGRGRRGGRLLLRWALLRPAGPFWPCGAPAPADPSVRPAAEAHPCPGAATFPARRPAGPASRSPKSWSKWREFASSPPQLRTFHSQIGTELRRLGTCALASPLWVVRGAREVHHDATRLGC